MTALRTEQQHGDERQCQLVQEAAHRILDAREVLVHAQHPQDAHSVEAVVDIVRDVCRALDGVIRHTLGEGKLRHECRNDCNDVDHSEKTKERVIQRLDSWSIELQQADLKMKSVLCSAINRSSTQSKENIPARSSSA